MHNHISDLAVNSVDASEQTLSDLDDGSLEVAVRSLRSPTNRGRRDNQDNYLVVDGQGCARFLRNEQEMRSQLPDWPPGHRRLAVLDGMGGHSHGREAAERTIEGLLELPATADLDQLSSALDALHGRLYREFQAAGLETGCTLIVLEIPVIGSALLFHVGDSRVYAVDEQQVQCLTVDHVPATHLALLGLVDSAQWLQQVHSRPNSQISQAFVLGSTLGIPPSLYVESIAAELFVLHDGNLPLFLRGLSDRRPLTPPVDAGIGLGLSARQRWALAPLQPAGVHPALAGAARLAASFSRRTPRRVARRLGRFHPATAEPTRRQLHGYSLAQNRPGRSFAKLILNRPLETMHLKIRHILLMLLAALAIAFMQPLVSFLGGLALLLGVGGFIFRDLPPASQDALERRLLGWLRRARGGSKSPTDELAGLQRRLPARAAEPAIPVEPARPRRTKSSTNRSATGDRPVADSAGNIANGGGNLPPTV